MDKTKITDLTPSLIPDPVLDSTPNLAQAEAKPAPDSAPPSNCDNATKKDDAVQEIGGRIGPDPTRFGDWEKAGRCIDF